jgi:hypothetical protein
MQVQCSFSYNIGKLLQHLFLIAEKRKKICTVGPTKKHGFTRIVMTINREKCFKWSRSTVELGHSHTLGEEGEFSDDRSSMIGQSQRIDQS